jgi:signal peptidase II
VGAAGPPVRAVQERRVAPTLTVPEERPTVPRRVVPRLLTLAAAVVALDQLTKTWAVRALDDHDIHVIWTLELNLTFNKGGAFSLGTGTTWFFVIAAVIVIVGVLLFGHRLLSSRLALIAMALVLGGALGNLGDRLFRDTGGAVVDFVDFRWWPVFNVADAAITVGGVLLVLAGSREPPVSHDDP